MKVWNLVDCFGYCCDFSLFQEDCESVPHTVKRIASLLPERIPYVIVTDQYFNTMKTIEVLLSDNRRFVMKCQASRFGPLFEPILHSQLVPMSSSAAFKVWNDQILLVVSYKNPPPKLN
jgi:hypothetical protein